MIPLPLELQQLCLIRKSLSAHKKLSQQFFQQLVSTGRSLTPSQLVLFTGGKVSSEMAQRLINVQFRCSEGMSAAQFQVAFFDEDNSAIANRMDPRDILREVIIKECKLSQRMLQLAAENHPGFLQSIEVPQETQPIYARKLAFIRYFSQLASSSQNELRQSIVVSEDLPPNNNRFSSPVRKPGTPDETHLVTPVFMEEHEATNKRDNFPPQLRSDRPFIEAFWEQHMKVQELVRDTRKAVRIARKYVPSFSNKFGFYCL